MKVHLIHKTAPIIIHLLHSNPMPISGMTETLTWAEEAEDLTRSWKKGGR